MAMCFLWQAPLVSYDYVENDTDPSAYGMSRHGTGCSGIVAAVKDNSHCGVGVAHESNLGSECTTDGNTMGML